MIILGVPVLCMVSFALRVEYLYVLFAVLGVVSLKFLRTVFLETIVIVVIV